METENRFLWKQRTSEKNPSLSPDMLCPYMPPSEIRREYLMVFLLRSLLL